MNKNALQEFALMIEEEYRAHFLLDNLPVAMTVFHENGPKLSFIPRASNDTLVAKQILEKLQRHTRLDILSVANLIPHLCTRSNDVIRSCHH